MTKPARPRSFRAELHPEVVGVVGLGDAVREAPVALKIILADTRDVEGRVGHHEVEPAALAEDTREELPDVCRVGVGFAHVP